MDILKVILEETRLFADSFYREQEELGVFDTPRTNIPLKETRAGLLNYIKQQLPNTPDHVLRDMIYNGVKGINTAKEQKEFIDYYKDIKWELKHDFLIKKDIFSAETQKKLADRKGGSANPLGVPRDAERHQQQKQLILKNGIPKEPIIMYREPDGYDLWEGWHRTIQLLEMFPEGYKYPNVYIGTKTLQEGVGDRYAEKAFGIKDTNQDYLRQTDPAVQDKPEWGEHVGYASKYSNNNGDYYPVNPKHPIFKNPRSLKDFDEDVRAFSDSEGNLYVGKINGDYVHGGMDNVVGGRDVYDVNNFIVWHRIGNTNEFGLSDSSSGFPIAAGIRDEQKPEKIEAFKRNLIAVRQKHPEFDFKPYYYQNDPEEMSGSDEYGYYEFNEGVGDKYLANKGIFPDLEKEYLRQTQAAVKHNSEMGELVGYIEFPSYVKNPPQEPIYKNPLSLRNFEADVRAVTDTQGNLYVAQHDGLFMHEGFANVFGLGTQMQIYTITKFITWHRVGKTNRFGLANSASTNLELMREYNEDDKLQEFFKILDAAQNKNSHFEFVPTIFYDVDRS